MFSPCSRPYSPVCQSVCRSDYLPVCQSASASMSTRPGSALPVCRSTALPVLLVARRSAVFLVPMALLDGTACTVYPLYPLSAVSAVVYLKALPFSTALHHSTTQYCHRHCHRHHHHHCCRHCHYHCSQSQSLSLPLLPDSYHYSTTTTTTTTTPLSSSSCHSPAPFHQNGHQPRKLRHKFSCAVACSISRSTCSGTSRAWGGVSEEGS